MKRELILVSLDWIRPKDPRRTLGHLSLLARLGLEPDVAVVPLEFAVNDAHFQREAVLTAILMAVLDGEVTIGIGAYVWNDHVVQWLLPQLRSADFRGRIVLGGPQISYAPPGVDAMYPDADVFVRGYGEDALVRILRGDSEILGVTRRGHDCSDMRAEVDLAALPSPHLLDGHLPPFLRWETQRGCPYNCSFCQHVEAGAKLPLRQLADARIDAEIGRIIACGVKEIAVLDPLFNWHEAHALRVLRHFDQRGFRGRISLQCRFEDVTPAFLDACERLNVVLEFGLQTIHPIEMKAIRRKNHMANVEAVIADLHRRGIRFEVSLIYGLPEQTLASFQASVDWCVDRRVPTLQAFPLMLLRGTAMQRDRVRWGLVENNDAIPLVVQSNTFTPSDWLEMRRVAEGLRVRHDIPVA
jgi:radical SAM superfamily enzyme YgiQ (UPF0313 family)